MTFVYFTDRDLGNQFPEILSYAGVAVEQHKQHFHQDAPDEEWLAEVSKHGWIVLTRDRRILYKPNELAAVKRHRISMLVMIGKAPHSDLAHNFIATLPRIEQLLIRQTPPLIAKVYRPPATEMSKSTKAKGRVELWYPRVGT